MASFYDQAGEAIGSVLREQRPSDAHNWGNVVPSEKWGITVGRWSAMLADIRERFEGLIDPCHVRAGEEFLGARTKPLYILQRRMADSVVCPGDDDHEEA